MYINSYTSFAYFFIFFTVMLKAGQIAANVFVAERYGAAILDSHHVFGFILAHRWLDIKPRPLPNLEGGVL